MLFASISPQSISQNLLVGGGSPIPTERTMNCVAARPADASMRGNMPRQ